MKSKINLTLKWRFTLLSIVIMSVTSGILMMTINYDIKKTMPQVSDSIISQVEQGKNLSELDSNANKIYTTPIEIKNNLINENEGLVIRGAIGNAVSNIYSTSIIIFFITIIVGALCTYFMIDKALEPIIQLNENIKKINGDNLTSNLKIQGPNDEIKELSISFNKMIAKLDNAFASQKRFNYSIAHELKTPLAIIKTNIDVLKNSKENSLKDYEYTLSVVEKSILKMNNMIEALLDIVKQENAPLNDNVNIANIIEDIVEDLNIISKDKYIDVVIDVKNIKNYIIGNEILLYRAFYNVIENSIKYNNQGGRIIIVVTQEKHSIKVMVKDNGKGIQEKDFENIFKPFYRCEGINISSTNGIGLGLSLTKSVINIHGGEILLESEINKGSTFTIILPIVI